MSIFSTKSKQYTNVKLNQQSLMVYKIGSAKALLGVFLKQLILFVISPLLELISVAVINQLLQTKYVTHYLVIQLISECIMQKNIQSIAQATLIFATNHLYKTQYKAVRVYITNLVVLYCFIVILFTIVLAALEPIANRLLFNNQMNTTFYYMIVTTSALSVSPYEVSKIIKSLQSNQNTEQIQNIFRQLTFILPVVVFEFILKASNIQQSDEQKLYYVGAVNIISYLPYNIYNWISIYGPLNHLIDSTNVSVFDFRYLQPFRMEASLKPFIFIPTIILQNTAQIYLVLFAIMVSSTNLQYNQQQTTGYMFKLLMFYEYGKTVDITNIVCSQQFSHFFSHSYSSRIKNMTKYIFLIQLLLQLMISMFFFVVHDNIMLFIFQSYSMKALLSMNKYSALNACFRSVLSVIHVHSTVFFSNKIVSLIGRTFVFTSYAISFIVGILIIFLGKQIDYTYSFIAFLSLLNIASIIGIAFFLLVIGTNDIQITNELLNKTKTEQSILQKAKRSNEEIDFALHSDDSEEDIVKELDFKNKLNNRQIIDQNTPSTLMQVKDLFQLKVQSNNSSQKMNGNEEPQDIVSSEKSSERENGTTQLDANKFSDIPMEGD